MLDIGKSQLPNIWIQTEQTQKAKPSKPATKAQNNWGREMFLGQFGMGVGKYISKELQDAAPHFGGEPLDCQGRGFD